MKKVLSVLVAVLLVVVACVPAFAATSTISLDASSKTAKAGDTITVSFKAGEGISALKATLEYDETYFKYVEGSAENGGMFGLFPINYTVGGKIVDAGASDAVVPAGTVFTAQFKVLKTGGTFTAKAEDAIGEGTEAVDIADAPALKIEAAPETTKAPTSAPETTAEPTSANGGSDNNTDKPAAGKNDSVKVPDTGDSKVSAVAGGVCVLALAAAVAYTMKKKNDEK